MKQTPLHQQPSSRIEQRVPLHMHVRARVLAPAPQIPSANPSPALEQDRVLTSSQDMRSGRFNSD